MRGRATGYQVWSRYLDRRGRGQSRAQLSRHGRGL